MPVKKKSDRAKKKKLVKPFNGNKISFGDRAADRLSEWAGSWTFIISLLVFMGLWIGANYYILKDGWDPYPFILLNFVLSTLAALQAPVILMSQNRMSEIDRSTWKYDYQVDRKAEREIQMIQRDIRSIKRLIRELRKK